METNVGTLRQQSAFQPSETPVIIVTDDPRIGKLELRAIEFYPDNEPDRGYRSVFKIKVATAK